MTSASTWLTALVSVLVFLLGITLPLSGITVRAAADPLPAPVAPLRSEPESRVVVLMYHHVSPNVISNGTITPDLFRAHLETIRRLGLPVISLAQLAAFLDGKSTLPPEAVALTFDDGYESFYTRVFPELRTFNVPAAVFVIVRPSEHPATARPSLPHLSWLQLSEMVASGLVTAGPHSFDQHQLVPLPDRKQAPALVSRAWLTEPQRGETVDEYEGRVLADFEQANLLFRRNLGFSPEYFAFPYGRYDPWLVRLSRLAGYRYLFTTRPGVVTRATDTLQIPRHNAGSQSVSASALEELLVNALRSGRGGKIQREQTPEGEGQGGRTQ